MARLFVERFIAQVGRVVAARQLPHVRVHRYGACLVEGEQAHTGRHLQRHPQLSRAECLCVRSDGAYVYHSVSHQHSSKCQHLHAAHSRQVLTEFIAQPAHLGPNARQRAQRGRRLWVRHLPQPQQPRRPAAWLRRQLRHGTGDELSPAHAASTLLTHWCCSRWQEVGSRYAVSMWAACLCCTVA